MEENYIKIYENETGHKIPNNFHIHHIDLNHNNNDITNLVMLPKELHIKYHSYLSNLPKDLNLRTELTSIISGGNGYNRKILKDLLYFVDIWEECCRWVDYRDYLLGKIPNVHHIGVYYEQ